MTKNIKNFFSFVKMFSKSYESEAYFLYMP